MNFSQLTIQQPTDYLIGPNDVLSISLPELKEGEPIQVISVTVMSDGSIRLPLVGQVEVAGLDLVTAQAKVNKSYASGIIKEPNITLALQAKATVGVLVLGQVKQPGVYYLQRFENDVGHAIAAAGGTTPDAADMIEVHRKFGSSPLPGEGAQVHQNEPMIQQALPGVNSLDSGIMEKTNGSIAERYPPYKLENQSSESKGMDFGLSVLNGNISSSPNQVVNQFPLHPLATSAQFMPSSSVAAPQIERIPMRGYGATNIMEHQITLMPGDVVIVPDRKMEVFYVVGRLSQNNTVRFTIGERERELGVGFVLPRDREIDVVTAVAMAGYIDPIESPTTVTVQRHVPDGPPMLINVDLIAARTSCEETVLVQPGDIIYLNPDTSWWFRKTFDRVVPSLIVEPFLKSIGR